MKRIMRFCKLTFMSSPLYFILNIICMLGFSLIQLGIKYSFKYASDTIISVQDSEVMSFSLRHQSFFFYPHHNWRKHKQHDKHGYLAIYE